MVRIEDILEQNLWWRIKEWESKDRTLSAVQNSSFRVKRKLFDYKNTVSIIYGPRQVGKTTYLKLNIKKLIENGIEPVSIAYFSCDALLTNKREELREAINLLLERGIKYLFIDEISNINDWSYELKNFIDSGKFDLIKVLVTGSPFGTREILPGRKVQHFFIMPSTFREFVIALSQNVNEKTQRAFNLSGAEIEEIETLAQKLSKIDFDFSDTKSLKKKLKKIDIYFFILEKLFNFYLITGGFPSLIDSYIQFKYTKNELFLSEEIKTNEERVIDSIKKAGKNEGICFQLINSINKRLCSRYSFSQLKETEIDLSKETIITYIDHLKKVYLVKVIYAYDFGKEEPAYKKDKKIYLIDSSLYHKRKILEEDEIRQDEEYLSKIVESIVGINLSYLKEDIFTPTDSFLFFWYNSKEIDFVFKEKKTFAIEVKFRRKIDKIYKISQIKEYLVLTKKTYDLSKKEKLIPVFLFLPLLKNKESYL
ncbi:MAG: AAA family ATPase [Nanoarchaeota archaeon]